MKNFVSWIGPKQTSEGLVMFSVLAIVNIIEFFTLWTWTNGAIAIFSMVLVAVLYEGGKQFRRAEEDGERG